MQTNLVLRVVHIKTTLLGLDELLLRTYEWLWMSSRFGYHGALHPMDDYSRMSLDSMDDHQGQATLVFPITYLNILSQVGYGTH